MSTISQHSPLRRNIPQFGRNVALGLVYGTTAGVLAALLGGFLFLVNGAELQQRYHLRLSTVLLTYVLSGALPGALWGVLRPLFRWRLSAISLGIVCGIITLADMRSQMHGAIAQWHGQDWLGPVLLGAGIGGAVGNNLWQRWSDGRL